MTHVLAVDTCGGTGYVGVFDMEAASIVADEVLPERGTQEALMPAIARVLTTAACTVQDLAALAIVAGPGSFTGVRIGMAAVKGLAEALDCPVITLSRLAVLAATVFVNAHGGAVHAWLDAGRSDLYAVRRSAEPDTVLKGAILKREEALRCLSPGDLVAVLEPALQQIAPNTTLVTPEEYRQSLLRCTCKAYEEKRFADAALLDAEYLRVPDAELTLRARMDAAEQAA